MVGDGKGDWAAKDNPLQEVLDTLAPEEQSGFQAAYGALYEALEKLTEQQRELITRAYGLDGGEQEPLADMRRRLKGVKNTGNIYERHGRAIERLRKYFKRA